MQEYSEDGDILSALDGYKCGLVGSLEKMTAPSFAPSRKFRIQHPRWAYGLPRALQAAVAAVADPFVISAPRSTLVRHFVFKDLALLDEMRAFVNASRDRGAL